MTYPTSEQLETITKQKEIETMNRFSEIACDIENQYNSDFDWDSSKTSPPVRYIEHRLLELCEILDARLTALEAAAMVDDSRNVNARLRKALLDY